VKGQTKFLETEVELDLEPKINSLKETVIALTEKIDSFGQVETDKETLELQLSELNSDLKFFEEEKKQLKAESIQVLKNWPVACIIKIFWWS